MRLFLVFAFSVLLVLSGRAQERISHVQVRVIDSSQLEIRYDLITIRPGDSIYFDVRSRLRGNLRIFPEFVRGDVGRYVTSGSERRIIWNGLENGYSLNEEIQVMVHIKTGLPITPNRPVPSEPMAGSTPAVPTPEITPPKSTLPEAVAGTEPKPITPETPIIPKPATEPVGQPAGPNPATLPGTEKRPSSTRYAGPAWALVSAVAPGIGNIFVQMPKPKVGIRPLLTVGCYGLLAYGFAERKKSQDDYAIYVQQKNMTAGEPYYQTANAHHQHYFLATRGAIILAAADVILTFIKGVRNTKMQKESRKVSSVTVWPGLQAGQLTAVARYSF